MTTIITDPILNSINRLHNLPEDARDRAAFLIGSMGERGENISDDMRSQILAAGGDQRDIDKFEEDIQEVLYATANLIINVNEMAAEQLNNNATK